MGTDNKKKVYTKYNRAFSELQEKPSQIKAQTAERTFMYRKILENVLFSTVDIICPDYWDKDYILRALFLKGYFAVTEVPNYNALPLLCSAYGINVFNKPTNITVANPVVGSFTRTIGKDCELVYLVSMHNAIFYNCKSLINTYAQRLADCDASIDINIYNCRTTKIYRATSPQELKSYQKMEDEIGEGRTSVFLDDSGMSLTGDKRGDMFQFKPKDMFVSDVMQIEKQNIFNEFLTFIGVNNANTAKRERLISSEVESNDEVIDNCTKLWESNVAECCERVRNMFGIDFDIKFTHPKMTASSAVEPKEGEDNVDESN